MGKSNDNSRRKFIKNAATGALFATVTPGILSAEPIAAPTILPADAKGANDRIRVAVLGINGRGKSHISEIMGLSKKANVEVAALCDPDMVILQERAKEFQKKYGKEVAIEQDFRKTYDDKSIDAVALATPNHWHALQTIWACQAGKDVYVEKPATHNIYEGKKMIEAAYKYNRIVQHGVQLRSSKAIQEAIKHLEDGLIGRVYMARGLVYRWRPDIGDQGISKVPEGLDYDLWTGPAPMRPFSRNLVHYNWHWHWNYGNGDVGNQGIHETDLCMWGLGVNELPERITSMGGKFLWDDCKEVPEIQTSVYHYPKQKKIIQFEVRNWCTNLEDGAGVGNIFYGDKGYLVVKGYGTYATYLGKDREPGPSRSEDGELTLHFENWFDAIRARDMSIQNGPVQTGHLSSSLAHLGNISYRLGRQLEFDPVAERFVGEGESEANSMLSRNYRAPYILPEIV
ncbi:Predicted dehydrogenase [Mariniphaga anaerophila]|uniref:Predicted dehydrogenase n=1 Tax=Mariniphaga anaerophila TaxID=1484053 RepID=A0A1M4Y549_9BACT|nr:Gfo/Idh/MocA family oxidoreductase [Mariniphaga anaerophila]SHF00800.1 Predicted dehydrogenase [Mariniphaga anaerophila]